MDYIVILNLSFSLSAITADSIMLCLGSNLISMIVPRTGCDLLAGLPASQPVSQGSVLVKLASKKHLHHVCGLSGGVSSASQEVIEDEDEENYSKKENFFRENKH
jgi:hypothetical protein